MLIKTTLEFILETIRSLIHGNFVKRPLGFRQAGSFFGLGHSDRLYCANMSSS